MNNFKLVETEKCPICGGQEREVSNGMAREAGKKLQGVYYLKPAAAALGISLEELVGRVNTYRCLSCGNYFCDPWFSPELASSLFCAVTPDHLFAWGNFENWLHRLPPGQTRNQRLYAMVTRKIGAISSYAELGCPFQGFLMQWKGDEIAPPKRISLFAQALKRDRDMRWSRITRLFNGVQHWAGRLTVLSLRIRGVLVRLAASKQTRTKWDKVRDDQLKGEEVKIPSLPGRRYLLTRGTTLGWGGNCVRYGASCQYFAHKVLGADVLPMDDVQRNGVLSFDLIGIFNSLDHTAFPIDVIRRSLQLADHVLLVTHGAAYAGKQHLFAFGDGFAGWLSESLEGISAENLYTEADPGEQYNNHILLSRKSAGR